MLNFITWNANPVAFSVFGLEIRWYGVMFVLAFLSSTLILYRMMKKEGRNPDIADSLVWYVAIAVIIGARLGHCFFYEPRYYLSHPVEILMIRDGGLASHGAAICVPIAIWLVARRHKVSFWYLLDRVVIVTALGGFFVRMGNLFNSEIYGHVTELPWGFIFLRNHEVLPKHPTQIYEALSYLVLFIILLLYYLKKKRNPKNGILFGWFLIGCFGMRFLIEFLKEVQVEWESAYLLDMGQILSLPFIAIGILVLWLSHKGLLSRHPGNTTKKDARTPGARR